MTDDVKLGCLRCRGDAWDVDVYLCHECGTLWEPWLNFSESPPKEDAPNPSTVPQTPPEGATPTDAGPLTLY